MKLPSQIESAHRFVKHECCRLIHSRTAEEASPLFSRQQLSEPSILQRSSTHLILRTVVWSAITVLLITGPLLLHEKGIPITDPSGWPRILATKLGLVTILLFLTLAHDFVLGPLVGQIMQLPTENRTSFDQALVLWSPWIARFSVILALAVLFTAVTLVRS